ncbi:MAG: HPr family phosphocarrier protein [Ancrocorticia sp.]|uniref:PTS sugar transporter subunit IIA domain-containing protein n=1 Tax=Ancrocorticia sp. TaxID=2593684 RepID=UPI003F8F8D58
MAIGFVLVSHSKDAAHAVAQLAAEMAPDVHCVPVGGNTDGGFGTDVTQVIDACDKVEDTCERVIVMADLGSARMAAEMAVEAGANASDGTPRRVMGPGPFLEGTVSGTAAAQGGARLAQVVRAIASSLQYWRDYKLPEKETTPASSVDGFQTQVMVVDDAGLHARPAAVLAQRIMEEPVNILINGVAGDSMMEILLLGVQKGERVIVSSPDRGSEESVKRIAAAIAGGLA